jgi:hypothetical protein
MDLFPAGKNGLSAQGEISLHRHLIFLNAAADFLLRCLLIDDFVQLLQLFLVVFNCKDLVSQSCPNDIFCVQNTILTQFASPYSAALFYFGGYAHEKTCFQFGYELGIINVSLFPNSYHFYYWLLLYFGDLSFYVLKCLSHDLLKASRVSFHLSFNFAPLN